MSRPRRRLLLPAVLLLAGALLAVVVAGAASSQEPRVAEPRIAEPRVAEPRVTEPRVAEPRVTGPQAAEPRASTTVQLSRSQVELRRGAPVELSPEVVKDLERVRAKPFLVRQDAADRRVILAADLEADRSRPFYRSRLDLVYELAVAPGERYTAALESVDGRLETGELGEVYYAEPPRNEMVVLDASGRVVCRVRENVQRFAFSPDGDRLAYLVGSFYEGGVGFRPEAVFVLTVDGCRSERVGASDVYEVAWGGGGRDAALHLRTLDRQPDRRVLRLDAAGRLAPSPHGAFHVSGDGRYFLKRPHEMIEEGRCRPDRKRFADCFGVYAAGDGRRTASQPPAELGRPVGWVYGAGAFLAFVQPGSAREPLQRTLGRLPVRAWLPRESGETETRVWDAERATVVQRLAGSPLERGPAGGWVASSAQLLVRSAAEAAERPGAVAPGAVTAPERVRSLRITLPPETVRRLEEGGGG